MKKILAFTLALLMMYTAFALAGCKSEETESTVPNVNSNLENFDSYVSQDSQIIGEWIEATSDEVAKEIHWTFFKNTTVHISSVSGDVSTSNVGAYNFNDETGELSYYVYQTGESGSCIATIEGNTMTFEYENGTTVHLKRNIVL